MNKADSRCLADRLESAGCTDSAVIEEADIVLVNSCVVRQSAENKVVNKLDSLRGLKRKFPQVMIVLTGCMVGSNDGELKRRFPWVDLFLPPQGWEAFDRWLDELCSSQSASERVSERKYPVSALVPIVHGCDSFCSYCIVPYRRGRIRSRPVDEIVQEVEELVQKGTREVCLLGQIVDQYGCDLASQPELADLLTELNAVQGLERIRFLTSHPAYMNARLVQSVAELDKVCEHISLPVQSGDDRILAAMRRGYTAGQYVELVRSIRDRVPDVCLSTDLIVGFPGETAHQFASSVALLRGMRFDKVHVAAYSARPGTLAAKTMSDDVEAAEKERRRRQIEELQQRIAADTNAGLTGQTVEVLVEGAKKGKWQGRTRGDKLVFFSAQEDLTGQLVTVRIKKTSAFALQGSRCD